MALKAPHIAILRSMIDGWSVMRFLNIFGDTIARPDAPEGCDFREIATSHLDHLVKGGFVSESNGDYALTESGRVAGSNPL